jgi:hydrogenase expression/formation protein HypC
MCLAVPGKLVTLNGIEAVADLHGNRLPICTALIPDATVGDWVLIHAGFAIQRISEEDAAAKFQVLREVEVASSLARKEIAHARDVYRRIDS